MTRSRKGGKGDLDTTYEGSGSNHGQSLAALKGGRRECRPDTKLQYLQRCMAGPLSDSCWS